MLPPSRASEGLRLVAQGQLEDAVKAFQEALASDPGDPRCLLGLARALISLKRDGEAEKVLDQLLQVRPGHGEARSHRAAILARRGDPAGLPELEAAAADKRAGIEEHLNLGLFLLSQKQIEKAQRSFEAAVRVGERDLRPHLMLSFLHQQRGDHPAAIAHALKATQMAGALDPEPHLQLARAYRAASQGRPAAAAYLDALRLRRDDPALYQEAYQSCLATGELDSAMKIVVMARESNPAEPAYLEWLQEVTRRLKTAGPRKPEPVRFDQGDRHAQAARQAVAAPAGSLDVEAEIARINQTLRKHAPTPPHVAKDLIPVLERVLKVRPDHGDAMSLLALCKLLTRKPNEAWELAVKALSLAEAARNLAWKQNAKLMISRLEALRRRAAQRQKGGKR